MDDYANLKLYRRRYIPAELIHLKDDHILRYEPGSLLITEWKTLKPRKDFARGVSAFFPDKGIKVSKLMDEQGQITRWYCDIGAFHLNPEENSLTFEDLLFDVVVHTDGSYQVLDIGEAADAYKQQLISEFNDLHINGMPKVEKLNALVGGYINLEYRLPNGQTVKFLDDNATYLGNQLECEFGGDRCFGIAANMDFLLVCTYEENGENPELVVYKKR